MRIIVQVAEDGLITAETPEFILVTEGEVGPPGPVGPGSPPGGLTGQHLSKASDADFDTEWETPPNPLIPLDELTDVSVPAPANGDQLTWDEDLQLWISRKSGAALGFTELDYKLSSPPDSAPNAGYMSADSQVGAPATATTLYFNKIDDAGNDLSLWFPYMKALDWLNVHFSDDTNIYARYDVTGPPVLNGDVWEVPVTHFDNSGDTLPNQSKLRIFWRVLADDPERMRWRNKWQSEVEYERNDVVYDDGWAMVANKTTTDRAAPQTVGNPYNLYYGDGNTDTELAKTLTYGMRYKFDVLGYLTGYRLYTVAGNHYEVYTIYDPDGAAQISELYAFTAETTGWINLSMAAVIVVPGLDFVLAMRVDAPADTPITWIGDWNYTTPNNAGTPGAGEIEHANLASDQFRVSKTDNAAGDRGVELLALEAGDKVSAGGLTWTVQSVSDNGTYVTLGVAPQTQIVDGLYTFTFETVEPTPITYFYDTDFWAAELGVTSFYVIDGAAAVPSNDQFGIDIEVQNATLSEDWDLLSAPGGGGGGVSDTPDSAITKNIWKFAVYKDTAQSLSSGVPTKVIWEQKDYDTNQDFNNNEYTAPFDGYFSFQASVVTTTASGLDQFLVEFYKNGILEKTVNDTNFPSNSNFGGGGGFDVFLLEGETISVWVTALGGTPSISALPVNTNFSGFLIANFADEQNALIDTGDIIDGAVTPEKRSGGYAVGIETFSSTGPIVISGLDFTPKMIQITAARSTTVGPTVASSQGYATSPSNQSCTWLTWRQSNTSGASDSSSDSILVIKSMSPTGDSTVNAGKAQLTSIENDGFILNVTEQTQAVDFVWAAFG